MVTPRVHFPRTTASQRRLLFSVWQATGNVARACQAAHVCERTFYKWKPRFLAHGIAGLAEFASPAPHHPAQLSAAIAAEVVALRQAHPTWGKRRLAQAVAQAHDWQPVVAPNTVKRILRDAGLWTAPPLEEGEKGGPPR